MKVEVGSAGVLAGSAGLMPAGMFPGGSAGLVVDRSAGLVVGDGVEGEGGSPAMLREAFSEFIAASARLEMSYRELQGEVGELGRELAERNLALGASLAENRGMRESLEQILDAMPCGVLVVEGEGEIRMRNPEAARLLAMDPDGMRSLAEVRSERGIDLGVGLGLGLGSGWSAIAEDGAEQELSLSGPGGERWLAVRRRALDGATTSDRTAAARGSDRRSVVILRDVSARRRMEAERDRSRSAMALAEVSAVLAHEIRNPLASMELFAGLMEDCPERAADWISPMRAGIRALGGTVNNVLAMHGGAAPAMETVELRRELALAVEFLQPQAEQAGVAMRFEANLGEALVVRANRSAVQQIVLNLGTNALKHTPAGGRVVLGAGRRPGVVWVSVCDTGSGMPAEFLPRMFHERFSGSGSTSGLGLAVCGRLMRQMGGSIHVESELGKGSVFTLEFPAMEAM